MKILTTRNLWVFASISLVATLAVVAAMFEFIVAKTVFWVPCGLAVIAAVAAVGWFLHRMAEKVIDGIDWLTRFE